VTGPSTTRACVLVVEDDDRLLMAIEDVLSDEGYEIRLARNGQIAIETLLSGFVPDVILLDLMMPGSSGFEVVNWVQQKGLGLPIILCTQEDDVQAADVGAVVKLCKPFTIEQLLDAVTRALGAMSADARS